MSIRYTIEDLQKKRQDAGLGTLSLGTAGMSGEMVSSTPIPDSRCGGPSANVADYGGYLVGEGMTPAVARYLASLHNAFPNIAKHLGHGSQIDEACRHLAEALGSTPGMWDWTLTDYINEVRTRLKRTPTLEEWNEVNAEIQRLREEVKINVHDCCEKEKADLRAQVKNLEPITEGQRVIVYDRFRFAVPLKAVITKCSDSNDGVLVSLQESNNQNYQIGSEVWVHRAQLRGCGEVVNG